MFHSWKKVSIPATGWPNDINFPKPTQNKRKNSTKRQMVSFLGCHCY